MELNVEFIEKELQKRGKNQSWLARELGYTRAAVSYMLKKKPITSAEKIAKVFKVNPKKLLT